MAGANPDGVPVATPEAIRIRTEKWQDRVLSLAEMVPEVAGTSSLVRGSVSRVKFRVELDPDSNVEVADPNLVADLQDRFDRMNFGRAAELLFLVGEFWVAFPELDDPFVLSPTEVDATKNPKQIKDAKGSFQDLPPTTSLFRVFKESNQNRYHAISAHKAALGLMEAMFKHQIADSAIADSRLISAGILAWPTERKSMPLNPDTGRPEPGSMEELQAQFAQMAQRSLQDSSSLDAKVPFLLGTDIKAGRDAIPQMIRVDREDEAGSYASRFEAYGLRYAKAIELPIEQSTGMGATNHWSAWAIREDSWKSYLAQLVEIIREALELRVAGKYGMRVVVDARDLITKPDQTEVVMQMLGLRVVTTDSAIRAIIDSDLDVLVSQEPPAQSTPQQRDARSTNATITKSPSDFTVNGDRGGGRYREGA